MGPDGKANEGLINQAKTLAAETLEIADRSQYLSAASRYSPLPRPTRPWIMGIRPKPAPKPKLP